MILLSSMYDRKSCVVHHKYYYNIGPVYIYTPYNSNLFLNHTDLFHRLGEIFMKQSVTNADKLTFVVFVYLHAIFMPTIEYVHDLEHEHLKQWAYFTHSVFMHAQTSSLYRSCYLSARTLSHLMPHLIHFA